MIKNRRMKEIPGYENYFATTDGKIFSGKSQEFLKQFIKSKKAMYLAVNLYVGGTGKHKFKQECVHTLILNTFVGPMPEGYHCAHLDGSRDNNNLDNLRWVTVKENMSHKKIHGTTICGERNPRSKLTTEQVLWLRGSYCEHNAARSNLKELAAKLGIHSEVARKIIRGESWSHIKQGIKPHHRPKITKEQIAKIKRFHIDNPSLNYQELAKELKVGSKMVSNIIQGKTWKHIEAAKHGE
jgi:plasmid maintenance system antidote protein VapI